MGKDAPVTQYDPQIGAAAQQTAASSAAAQQFSENFYNTHISPLLDQMVDSSKKTQGRQDDLYGLNVKQTADATARYDQYGKPAEARYYDMVDKFSGSAEQERQAQSALGDMKTAEAGQAGDFMRSLGARGINPTSGAATSTMGDMATTNAAAEAGAMNRARNAARNMGMTLTGDAANFGRGGASNVLAFGQAASGNAGASFGAATGALAGANGSAGVPLAGYNTAISGYSSNMANYTKLGVEDMDAQAKADAGFGQAIGSIIGMAAGKFPSDRRLKKNITLVAQHSNGLRLYGFDYRWGGARQCGLMADEVEQIIPHAVSRNDAGFQLVDYQAVRDFLCV